MSVGGAVVTGAGGGDRPTARRAGRGGDRRGRRRRRDRPGTRAASVAQQSASPAGGAAAGRGLRGKHDDVRRLTRVPAHDVAAVRRTELPRELELDEAEERRQSPEPAAPAAWGRLTSSEYLDGFVRTVGLSILPRRSISFAH